MAKGGGTYVDKVAWTRALKLASVGALVFWLTMAHPVRDSRAIVSDGPCLDTKRQSVSGERKIEPHQRTSALSLHVHIVASIVTTAAAAAASATLVKVPPRDIRHVFYVELIKRKVFLVKMLRSRARD